MNIQVLLPGAEHRSTNKEITNNGIMAFFVLSFLATYFEEQNWVNTPQIIVLLVWKVDIVGHLYLLNLQFCLVSFYWCISLILRNEYDLTQVGLHLYTYYHYYQQDHDFELDNHFLM